MSRYRAAKLAWERAYLAEILAMHNGNRSKAAAYAGINRTCFYKRMKRCGIPVRQYKYGNDAWRALEG